MIYAFLRNKLKHTKPLIDYALKCTPDLCLSVFQPNGRQIKKARYRWNKSNHYNKYA